ncbi:MAG: flavodoxin family protein [Methanosphaera sp.]|nr:flavodoxin family protein [Methanosphaera sp.]
MKIIGVNTSPRENSNTSIAVKTALEASEAKGAQTEYFDLSKMNITDCQGDSYCKSHDGKCAIDDDMQKIYKAIEESDAVILGAPIYFGDVNATAKTFIDRLYAYFMFPFTETYGNKKASLIVSQGAPDAEAFTSTMDLQTGGLEALGFEIVDKVAVVDNNVPGAINDKQDQLDLAKSVGEKLVE